MLRPPSLGFKSMLHVIDFRPSNIIILTSSTGRRLHSYTSACLYAEPVFLVNSCLGLFTAVSYLYDLPYPSYGVILPSSLTIVLSLTLGSLLDHLWWFAVQVPILYFFRSFSWKLGITRLRSRRNPSSYVQLISVADLPTPPAFALKLTRHLIGSCYPSPSLHQ